MKVAPPTPTIHTCDDGAPSAGLPLTEFEYAGDVDAVDWRVTPGGEDEGEDDDMGELHRRLKRS